MNFISPVEAVESIWIKPLPAHKIILAKRVIRVGRHVLIEGQNGQLYSDGAKNVCYTPGAYDQSEAWFKALQKLGRLTKEQLQAHKQACDNADKIREMRYIADDLYNLDKKGIKLTKQQRTLMEKYSSYFKRDQLRAQQPKAKEL
jgi:hypothetical protein